MIRYIGKEQSSSKVTKYIDKHIPRLGEILSIVGKRFTSTRSYRTETGEKRSYTTNYEVVVVKGVNGTARFAGVCWGYGGAGPHVVKRILVKCGLSVEVAEAIAFHAPRNDSDGIDWEYNIPATTLKFHTRTTVVHTLTIKDNLAA